MAPLELRVLGTVGARRGDRELALGGPKQRSVLVVLALRANQVVADHELIDAVWGEDSPERAVGTLQVYVSNLRKALADPTAASGGPPVIERVANGYRLRVDPGAVDASAFERLTGLGRTALREQRPMEAIGFLERGLALWSGEPAEQPSGDRANFERTRLDELRIGAQEDLFDARLAAGDGAELVPDVEAQIRLHPYRERLRAQLIRALYGAGRQVDALRAYQDFRQLLADELGIEPGPELRELEHAVLDQSLGTAEPAARRGGSGESTTIQVASAEPMLAMLRLPDDRRVILGSQPCILGRSSGCTVAVDGPDVSRRHAVIRLVAGGFVLTDLGSTNGTTVNGELITERPLGHGDVIELAGSRLVFEIAH